MGRYLKEKAKEIPLARGRASQLEPPATPQEVTGMRGLVGSLSWATREGMPQGAGEASLLAGSFPEPKVADLKEANASLKRLLQQDIPIPIRPIPLERLKLVVFADSSLANAGGGNSQICHMVCAADQAIREGKEADISCLTYKSHKNNRAGSSTLLVEANGLSEGLADAEWVASWIGLAKSTSYDMRKRHEMNREIQITAVLRESDSDLKDLLAVTDAKSMYDNLTREQYTGAEKRAALEICVIRDSLDSMNGICRWVPHEENPVDCMTKL